MAWLLREGEVLASLEVVECRWGRVRGLAARGPVDGAVLLTPARAVHTVGVRRPLDVAVCDAELVVLSVHRLAPFHMTRPRVRARCVIEAEAGSFERWALRPGDRLEVKG